MQRRFRRIAAMPAAKIAAVLIGLGSTAAILSQSSPSESPRLHAWRLARDLIQESETREGIPKFVAWATAREIFPCGDPSRAVRGASSRNVLDESFHYSPEVAIRMCAPLSSGMGAVPLDAALAAWEKSEPKPSITLRFPDSAHLAAAFWNAVRRPANPHNGKLVQMDIRSGNEVQTRRIRIIVPKNVAQSRRTEATSCPPPTDPGAPGVADAADVSLEEFFWVRLKPGERYNGASCGDFAVLMAFHLVHKVQGRWLWTTFWWDPESKEFGADRPRDFNGAGPIPRAWRNYAMDASFESTATIFNPWRVEEHKDNCARCHAEVTLRKSATSDAQINFDSVTAASSHFQ
jgi:hypothetical protein